jgi:DNA-nicking Smr family endonuclease
LECWLNEDSAFNRGPSAGAEQELDRLRDLAHAEDRKQHQFVEKSKAAYAQGDHTGASRFSQQAKAHEANEQRYHKQASDFIFRENNADLPGDTIDLHGQYVREAVVIVKTRITAAQQQGQSHLHVIVGKGNHSQDHVQKIKPAVEQVCRELGLNYRTEENQGRLYVDLTGGEVHHMPPPPSGYGEQWGAPSHSGGGGGYPGQHHGGGHGQQQQQNDDAEKVVKGIMKLFKSCCTVM